jgi:hypothetical protein
MDAATITPAAKPVKARWIDRFMPVFKKNTHPAPNDVPMSGRKSSINTFFIISGCPPLNSIVSQKFSRLALDVVFEEYIQITPPVLWDFHEDRRDLASGCKFRRAVVQ